MVRIGEARAAAVRWVERNAGPAFRGAYFSGSTTALPDDAELPPTSDVDLMVVTAHETPPMKPGKFHYDGVLLEAGYVPERLLATDEGVLSDYHLAGPFRHDTIIADPTGRLAELRARVSRDFADPAWVWRRCEDALRRSQTGLTGIDPAAPFHQQVTGWLFPTGVTTHVVLVAALRNPTVRLRYTAARAALEAYGFADRYPELRRLLGCERLDRERAERHLANLARTFDATATIARTPFPFSGDITPEGRPVAIDGSRRLIESGAHREAMFWIVATFARCHAVLAADADAGLRDALAPDFRAAAADLGVAAPDDIRRRTGEVLRALPRVRELARRMVDAGPAR